MSDEGAPRSHWVAGRQIDPDALAPTRATPRWSWALGLLAFVGALDLALEMLPSSDPGGALEQPSRARLRASLLASVDALEAREDASARAVLLLGDATVLDLPGASTTRPLKELLREHVHPDTPVDVHVLGYPGMRPRDVLALVTELDRLDPQGRVELLIELDLRDFAFALAERGECGLAAACELGPSDSPTILGELQASTRLAHDWLSEHAPLVRQRDRLRPLELPLGATTSSVHDPLAELRDPTPTDEHAQILALDALLERLHARRRSALFYLAPLDDERIAEVLPGHQLGRAHELLARRIAEFDDPRLRLVDLDHPLFVSPHFVDGVHLTDEGQRLLAINLLFEANVRLAERPLEIEVVHPEGHDRTFVHRVTQGFADGGATRALFDQPEGVASDRRGSRIIVADTGNHMLRQLRGSQQIVERLAGAPDSPGWVDGDALGEARFEQPRFPELLDEAVYVIDGPGQDRIRVVERGFVRTLTWEGAQCEGFRRLRGELVYDDELGTDSPVIWTLCTDGSLLRIDVPTQTALLASEPQAYGLVAFDLAGEFVYLADDRARIWQRRKTESGELSGWRMMFANVSEDLLPIGYRIGFPYHVEDIGLAKVVDLRWVERYQSLLVADEHPFAPQANDHPPSERVHLRLIDFDAKQVLPWIKVQPHGEAFTQWNESAQLTASYYHLGSMALAQDDAGLIWLEQGRSRLFRIGDGLLGVAQNGNHHTSLVATPRLTTIFGEAMRKTMAGYRPDRFLDSRWEPLPRQGPYTILVVGSSLSSMSDRFANYSLGRRIVQELQRDLGYRDHVRVDLFQISAPASKFGDNVKNLTNWFNGSAPPDIIFIEAHDFGGGYLGATKTPAEVAAAFAAIERLAARYQSLVIFYDNSQIEANRRDGMRSTDGNVRRLLAQARQLGFVVLEPGDQLLPRMLTEAPWGNQPFGHNMHHGSHWAVDRSAEVFGQLAYPVISEFLRDRVPARWREQPPEAFEQGARGEPLRPALDAVAIDRSKLPQVRTSHLQRDYTEGRLRVHIDLAGYPDYPRDRKQLDRLAIAAIVTVLEDDIYADLAHEIEIEIVEFANYDEYGEGVLDSATSHWRSTLDRKNLQRFLERNAPKERAKKPLKK